MALRAWKLSRAFEKWTPVLNGIFVTQNFLTCGNHDLRVPFYKGQKQNKKLQLRLGGGYSQKIWVGCAAHFQKSLSMTKMYNTALPYIWPEQTFNILFTAGAAGTVAQNVIRSFVDSLINNDEKVASSKKHTQLKTR